MDDMDNGQYERIKIKRAKRLVVDFLSQLEVVAKQGPDEAELVRREQERIADLVAGRRQREAKLVGEFDSDEIYDPADDDVLSMRQGQLESRRRIKALCEGRRLADCTELVIDDLLRELQTFLTSCGVFVGLTKPGRNAAEVICVSSGGERVEATVGRDGDVHRRPPVSGHQDTTTRAAAEGKRQQGQDDADPLPEVGYVDVQEERSWERTCIRSRHLLNPEIVFKCVDGGTSVVLGSASDRRGGKASSSVGPNEGPAPAVPVDEISVGGSPENSGKSQCPPEERIAVPCYLNENEVNQEQQPESKLSVDGREVDSHGTHREAQGAILSSPAAVPDAASGGCADGGARAKQLPSTASSSGEQGGTAPQPSSRPGGVPNTDAVRPQVCVPLVGAGDSGCIGMVGVQGFSTGVLVGDDDWWDWFMHRMEPFDKGENRNVKRIKLVRPRGLPDKGKLEEVPTGIAAKVVCGSVERISRKRGMPVYSVRWEDGLRQLDVPKRYMREFVAEDNASSSKGVPLTADVLEHLTWIGKTVGPVLDEVRKAIHITALRKVTLAGDARHRDVLELALLTLIECLPSIDAAEVWQLDNDGGIRCVQGLASAEEQGRGQLYRSNERVNGLLHAYDAESFCLNMETAPNPVARRGVNRATPLQKGITRGGRQETTFVQTVTRSSDAAYVPKVLVIRPKRTPGIIAAAPFRDHCFKVGRSWVGADRLSRGFALVLRKNIPGNGQDNRSDFKAGGAVMGTGNARGGTSAPLPRDDRLKSKLLASEVTRNDSHASVGGNVSVEDGNFSARVAREVGVALVCVRGRERRAALRAQALKNVSAVCLKSMPSGKEAKEVVLAEISAVLPGCRAYIGVLQPGGHALLYESATPNSAMAGRELRRGEGISFEYLDDPEGQIRVVQHRDRAASETCNGAPEPPRLEATAKIGGPKPPKISVGDAVRVWYASSWLPATVVRAWGHEAYDVRYEDFGETEAGVPRWRLREVITLDHLKVKLCWGGSSADTETDGGDDDRTIEDAGRIDRDDNINDRSGQMWPWPFVCAPLRSAGNRVGVLGVDGWSGVELGRPEEVHPERAVVKFLCEAATLLADALYKERQGRGLSALGKTLKGQDTTQNSALEALIMLLRETVTFRTRIDVLEIRATDPGAVFCRGTWESIPCGEDKGKRRGQRHQVRSTPPRVYDTGVAPRVEELCVTPAQFKQLGNVHHRGVVAGDKHSSPQRQKQQSLLLNEITPYQREMLSIVKDGPGMKNGLQARALATSSRRGEIVGRFQRLLVRAGGGRPSADGWFLIRVARALPEDAAPDPLEAAAAKSRSKANPARRPFSPEESKDTSEDGDIWLLSEMCRRLEVGFMSIAGREQRAVTRAKALERMLNCCRGFNVAATARTPPTVPRKVADAVKAEHRVAKRSPSALVSKGREKAYLDRAEASPGATKGDLRVADNSGQGKLPSGSKNRVGGAVPPATATEASTSPVPVAAAALARSTLATTADAGVNALTAKSISDPSKSVLFAAEAVAAEEDPTTNTRTDQDLVFSTPMRPPTPAETSDGRKGALVTLKDSRLAVLVHRGDRRVAVVEQPGGRQENVPESEVVPGQSVFLQSGREALLVETMDGPNALVIVGPGGKASVVEETSKGKLKKLPLSALKKPEALAALAAGEAPLGALSGTELMKQVIASAQWVLPQVDIYIGELSPFGAALNFTTCSSRSNAAGRRIYRHSMPNGGSTFGVEEDSDVKDGSNRGENSLVQAPSWDVIDTGKRAVIPGVYSKDSSRLHFFSDPLQQGWPWVAIPIRPGAGSRAVRGIFCVDRFEDPWADEETVKWHPEKDIISYLETSSSALGLALDREAKASALRMLRSIVLEEGSPGPAIPTAISLQGGGLSSSPAAMGEGVRRRGRSTGNGGPVKSDGHGGGNNLGGACAVSSPQDVYSAVTTALSKALVHCKRFEVWEATQPCDEDGRFFLEPSLAGQPPPFRAEDGDTREYLKLQITHCTGLAKADRFGLSDPFCVVKWPRSDQELGRTPTIYNTVHPVWKACYFEVPLETPTPETAGADVSSRHSEHKGSGENCRGGGGDGGGGDSDGGGFEGSMNDETIELTVQVWDEDEGAGAEFLGELKFDAQALLEMAQGRLKQVLPLEPKPDESMTEKQRQLVQGSIGLCVSPATDGAISRLQEAIDAKKIFLEVIIQGSLGLGLGNDARVFAAATLDGKGVGETAAMTNGCDPVWMETIRVELARDRVWTQRRHRGGGTDSTRHHERKDRGDGEDDVDDDDVMAANFSIMVWNHVQSQGHRHLQSDECEFVGRVDLSLSQLAALSEGVQEGVALGAGRGSSTKSQKVPLKNRDGIDKEGSVLVFTVRETSPKEWRAGVADAAAIENCYADTASVEASGLKTVFERRVRLTVLRATGLAQADDTGSADPMCVLGRRGREVGRTTTIYGSLEPVWGTKSKEGESFLLTIPHPREASFGGGGVVLEVFDEDFGDPNDFLGQVVISGNDLLRFHSPGTFKGTEAQSMQVKLQAKPEIPLSEQWLVQGEVFYRLEGVDRGEEEETDFVVVDLPRILNKSSTSNNTTARKSVVLQSSQYRRLEIRVIEARGLAKADRFGLSDPYVVIRANGNTQLGRTRTIALSLEPVWTNPDERFVVAVGLEDAARCDLTLEVWDDDDLGQGDFLGQVPLPKSELLEFSLPTGPIECELEKNENESDDSNKLVQGVLTFSIREAYGDMPDEPPEGEGSGGEVLLTVLSATGLAKADVFGKSDPFGMVLQNRREIGRTRTLFKTLDPCWIEPKETFSLRITGNRARCSVVVQLWDEDLGKRGDFLGQASLRWEDLHLPPGEASHELDLKLGFRDGVPRRDQELVQGTIKLLVEAPVIEAKVGDGVARSYVVTIDRAWGLAKADRFGKADPIVYVKVNGDGDDAERGRTNCVAGTLHPVWRKPAEVFILTGVEELILEIWDVDYLKKGDFLGEVRLSKQELAEHVPVDGDHEFTAVLQPKPNDTDRFNRLVQGSLRFTCQDWMSPERLVLEGFGEQLKLTVVSASGLPRGHHFGLSDPLACVRWNGLEVGRTRAVKKSTSPNWEEGFQVVVPLESEKICRPKGCIDGAPEVEVVVEILDAGAGEAATLPTTVVGTRSALICQVSLGEPALRLPDSGPPCKVLELPVELPKTAATRATGNAKSLRKGGHESTGARVGSGGMKKRPGTIVLFLERLNPLTRSRQSSDTVGSSEQRAAATAIAAASARAEAEEFVVDGNGNNDTATKIDVRPTSARASSVERRGGREEKHGGSRRPPRPPARKKMHVRIFRAWGLSSGARALNLVVAVTACGRSIGTTPVSLVGGTTSPEWIDAQFILPVEMCAVLSFEVWGHKMGSQDTFFGRASLRSTRQDMDTMAAHGESLELPLQRKALTLLPMEDQTLAKGHLLFSLLPWHDFDYARELEDSNAKRGLQVQLRLRGATNLTAPSASIFATFSLRGTELSKTDVLPPHSSTAENTLVCAEIARGTAPDAVAGDYSHVWPYMRSSTCIVPLPEECVDRRETEIEIDLWEEGGPDKEHGNHLGQVVLSGDFVPHLAHGKVVSRPLRPQRSHGSTSNVAARGSLIFQLWLRRGGESLASEFTHSAVTVEVLEAKGLLAPGSGCSERRKRQAFCVVKEDGTEIGRTSPSDIGDHAGVVLGSQEKDEDDHHATTNISDQMTIAERVFEPGNVYWEENQGDSNRFAMTLSPHQGGGLPLQLTVELWESVIDEADGSCDSISRRKDDQPPEHRLTSAAVRKKNEASPHLRQRTSIRRIGTAKISPESLVLSTPGRLSLPIEPSHSDSKSTVGKSATTDSHIRTGDGGRRTPPSQQCGRNARQPTSSEKTAEDGALHPKLTIRVTPQVGVHWGRRVMTAAKAAKRVTATPEPPTASDSSAAAASPHQALSKDSDDADADAHVVFMTNAEGSARTWRAPVTPGNSIPLTDYEDALELVFASVPGCCPRAPSLLVAPISDVGVRLGKSWIGPRIAARHAIVAHRPRHQLQSSSVGGGDVGGGEGKGERLGSVRSSDGGDVVGEPPREDELFVRLVAAEAETLLRDIRARDMRAEQRRMALKRVREVCDAWSEARSKAASQQTGLVDDNVEEKEEERPQEQMRRDGKIDASGGEKEEQRNTQNCGGGGGRGDQTQEEGGGGDEEAEEGEEEEGEEGEEGGEEEETGRLGGRAYGELYRGVLRAMEIALPGVSIYLGILENGAQSIRYVACTRQSSMAGKQLKRGEGVSFSCVGSRYAPYLVYPPRSSGASTQGHGRNNVGNTQRKEIFNKEKEEEQVKEEEGDREKDPVSSLDSELTEGEVTDPVKTAGPTSSIGREAPHAEKSVEEGVVSIQKLFRGKLGRDRLGHAQQEPSLARKKSRGKSGRLASKKPVLQIPKVFDYEGRVGWPFVCVPLEGFLRSSSIGVLGLDTFEQMVESRHGHDQPEAGVVEMVTEAARALGNAICRDRRRCALNAVAQSCLSFKSSEIDVLVTAAKAVEDSIISSARVEVWKIDPSDGSLYVVTRRLPDPIDSALLSQHDRQVAGRSPWRQLKVEVRAAELSPAMADYYEASSPAADDPSLAIQSVVVRISTITSEAGLGQEGKGRGGDDNTFRTAPVDVKQFKRASCSPVWHEGHRCLHVTEGCTNLRAEVLARVERRTVRAVAGRKPAVGVEQPQQRQRQQRQQQQQQHRQQGQLAPPAEGVVATGAGEGAVGLAADEVLLAHACIDLSAVRDGYNYVPLFSPEDADTNKDDYGSLQSCGAHRAKLRRDDDGQETAAEYQGSASDEEEAATTRSARPMGQLVLRLSRVEPQEGSKARDEARAGSGHTTLIVRGASGLAKADSDSAPFCVVKWGGVELGRTKACSSSREPIWQEERFRLALSANKDNGKKSRLPLVMEVWDEDALGAQGDFLGQAVLQADQLETPAPGVRGLVLSKKPAADLKLSKQKFVQGTVEFALETPRAAAAAEAAAAAARVDASLAATADNREVGPSGAAVDGVGSNMPTQETIQALNGETDSSAGGARDTVKAAGSRANVNDKQAKSSWTKNKKGVTADSASEEKGGGGAAGSGRGHRQQHKRPAAAAAAAATIATATEATVQAHDDDRGGAAEWEGVKWDEEDAPEADSLGTVSVSLAGTSSASMCSAGSATLGTIELASKGGDASLAGLTDTQPKDMLICLKGVVGIRGAHKFGQSQIFCVVKVGQREVDRTRQLKLSPDVVWEAPEERFRVAVEDIKGAESAPGIREDLAPAGTTKRTASAGMAPETAAGPITKLDKEGEEEAEAAGRLGSAKAKQMSVADDVPPMSLLSVSPLASYRHPHQQQQQRSLHEHQGATGANSSLTISVWSKATTLGGRHDLYLGSATVPARFIDHPPGDVWVPLVRNGEPTTSTIGVGAKDGKIQRKAGDKRRNRGIKDVSAAHVGGSGQHAGPSSGTIAVPAARDKKRGGKKSWGSGLFKKEKNPGTDVGDAESGQPKGLTTGSVHVWLGKVRRGSSSGQQPGKGQAVLRVHAASGLRKADRYGKSDPKCFVSWNGDNVGSTSTVYDTYDPRWDADKETFRLPLPRDRSLCRLHVDLWDMDYAGTKRGDFLGRATVPPVTILHPPKGGRESPVTITLLRNSSDTNQEGATNSDAHAGYSNPQTAGRGGITATAAAATAATSTVPEKKDGDGSTLKITTSREQVESRSDGIAVGGGGTGNFASRMMHNVQRHFDIGDAITGTLTVSLELYDFGDGEEGQARREGVREPGVPPIPAEYTAAKFKVAEDANEARRRREREGIQVPRMLSRVRALHDRLGGAVITGPGAAKFSDLTDGAAAVIPEILAGQILSLARRGDAGAGYTVLPASGDGTLARDRLVVLLQPVLAGGDGRDSNDDLGKSNKCGHARRAGDQNGAGMVEQLTPRTTAGGGGRPVIAGADERPRHALVIPCVPDQISKEDIVVATDLARAADEASKTVRKRQLRQGLMQSCAKNVESLCEERKEHHEGLCSDVVAALEPACNGAGEEVDRPLRDMPVIVSLLNSGGYGLRVVTSSAGWSVEHVAADKSVPFVASGGGEGGGGVDGAGATSLSSAGETTVGRWCGPFPMASGLVKRVVDRGDIFLVIESTVYVANVSWNGIWQETMPHKHLSSSAALKESVALLREGLGPGVSKAFVLAPVWVPGVGCIGLITIADIPYSRSRRKAGRGVGSDGRGRGGTNSKHHVDVARTLKIGHGSRRHAGNGHRPAGKLNEHAKAGADGESRPHMRYAVGAGVVEFARKVGVALGTAMFRLRNRSLITSIKTEGGKYHTHGGKGPDRPLGGKKRIPLSSSSSHLPRPSSPVLLRETQQRTAGRGVPGLRGRGLHRTSRNVEAPRDSPVQGKSRPVQRASPPIENFSPEEGDFRLQSWSSLEMTTILLWPCPYEAVCEIYAAAIAALTQGLPWIRAADVWHISSIPDHETVFTRKLPPRLEPHATPTAVSPKSDNDGASDNETDTAAGDAISAGGGAGSIGTLTVDSGPTRQDSSSFCERVVGKTWSGVPAVVVRSLRVPGREEAAFAARWLRENGEDGGGVFGDDEGWTDQRLRLLADEWEACTRGPANSATCGANRGGGGDSVHASTTAATAAAGSGYSGAAAKRTKPAEAPESSLSPAASLRVFPRPFMAHTGHLIVPFMTGCVQRAGKRGENTIIGHGLILAVDRGVDWRRWESHLVEVAVVATRCFERLELDGEIVERERVRLRGERLLNRAPDHKKKKGFVAEVDP